MKSVVVSVFLAAAFLFIATSSHADNPSSPVQAKPVGSPGQQVLDKAASANKFALLLFWREQNAKTQKAWSTLQTAGAKLTDRAEIASIQANDPAEKALADRFDLTRTPMPVVFAIAPCGAVIKVFQYNFDEKQLETAFVSPCTQRSLKALQDRKLLMLCVMDNVQQTAVPQGVQDFRTDPQYGQATEVIVVDAKDAAEASLLRDLSITPQTAKPATVFIAPPSVMIGVFEPSVTKEQMVAKLVAAQNNPCAGGKCGPGGCCPKK